MLLSGFDEPSRIWELRKLTVNWLVDSVALALAVWQTTETSTGQQTNAAGDDTGLVANDITKQVARHDDSVQRTRALHHQHGGRVDQLVLELELGELVLEQLRDGLPPQTAGSQDVGLVETPDLGGRVLRQSQVSRQTSDPLDLGPAVGLRVHGEPGPVVLLAIAEINTSRQLTDDDEVGAPADFCLERGPVYERFGSKAAGPQVAVGAQLLAQGQDALLRADGRRGTPFGPANGAEENGVGVLCGIEGLLSERLAVSVDGSLRKG